MPTTTPHTLPLRRLFRLATLLLALGSALMVWHAVKQDWQTWLRANTGTRAVADLRRALLAAEMVSRERGPTNAALGDEAPNSAIRVQALQAARGRTDQAWAELGRVLADPAQAAEPGQRDAVDSLGLARAALLAARQQVDGLRARARADRGADELRAAVRQMVALVPMLASPASVLAGRAQTALPTLNDPLLAARLSAELREQAGQLGSHFTAALTRQQPLSATELAAVERTRGRIDQLRELLAVRLAAPGLHPAAGQAWQQAQALYFGQASALVQQVLAAGAGSGQYGLDTAGFAARYVPLMDSLLVLRDALLAQAAGMAAQARIDARDQIFRVVGSALLLVLILAGTVNLLNRRILQPLAATTRALRTLSGAAPESQGTAAPERDEMVAVTGAVQALQQQTEARARLEAERDRLIEQLRQQSDSDFLTGLPNRRAFFAAAERDLARAERHGHGVAVLLMDVDRFKQLNDSHGHATGDLALVAVAEALRRTMRQGDLVARYGGEEFVLLLPHSDEDSALRFAERLREAVAAATVPAADGQLLQMTASLGVAGSSRHGLQLTALLSQADSAMYAAKQAGRNRVQLAA